MTKALRRLLDQVVLGWVTVIGLTAFLYPFFFPAVLSWNESHVGDAPLLLGVLTLAVLTTLLAGAVDQSSGSAKSVALLGCLAAVNAALRLLPTFMGASPMFFLVILVGYVFGARHGFVIGALSMLLSALITGGVGPWLPYQMLGLGWVGAGAAMVTLVSDRRLWLLVLYGFLSGYGYGILLNLWFWPFVSPASPEEASLYWAPGMTLEDTLSHYAVFYVSTSAVYDSFRALGNAVVLAALGGPLVRLLSRYRERLYWEWTLWQPGRLG
jgi:energy-coupling factor transport system substrate-specific component